MSLVSTFIIGLPFQEANYRAVSSLLDSTNFIVSPAAAMQGRLLPDDVCLKLTGDKTSADHKGSLGCTMSHLRLWESILEMNLPYALVLEDDVVPHEVQRIRHLVLPESFDLVFCNDRTAVERPGSKETPLDSPITYHDLSAAVGRIQAGRQSVGADAYFISRRGAQKLLHYYAKDWYFGHVDMRMLAYSVSTDILEQPDLCGPLVDQLLKIRRKVGHPEPLTGFCCSSPLFSHPRFSQSGIVSRRKQENAAGSTSKGASLPNSVTIESCALGV